LLLDNCIFWNQLTDHVLLSPTPPQGVTTPFCSF
jgi:hypothetical protein